MQENVRPMARLRGERGGLYLLLAFLLPITILLIVFAVRGIHPFGPDMPFIVDLYQQYFPFVSLLKEKLSSGGSLMWSWEVAMGTNFLPLIAYYLASPLNLLISLAPAAFLREAMEAGMILRVGLAGLSCAVMLQRAFGKRDASLVLFALAYALCGFSMGYFWNTIWMDTFALAPLVLLGTVRLLRAGSPVLYVVTLALAIWCNFLMGLYTCIFVLLLFICLAATDWQGWRPVARRFVRIGLFTLLAFGLTAALLLPMLRSFHTLYRTITQVPSPVGLEHSFAAVAGNFAAMVTPTVREGLPNVYTGVLPLMLVGCFFRAPGVRLRDRVALLVLAGFLLISLNVNVLNFLWNGLTLPHQLPYRFSFLLSLVLVVIAFISYHRMETPHRFDYVGMLGMGLVIIASAALGGQPDRAIIATLVCVFVYTALIILFDRGVLTRPVLGYLLLAAFAVEISLAAPLTFDMELPRQDAYYHQEEDTRTLLAQAQAITPFSRVEVSHHRNDNEPALFGYRGVSGFTSTIRRDLTYFVERIGSGARPDLNRITYHESGPLANALFGLQYYIARDGNLLDAEGFFEPVGQAGSALLLENRAPLSLGFLVGPRTLDFTGDRQHPFLAQNDLFRRMTGTKGALFGEAVPVYASAHKNQQVTWQASGIFAYHQQFPEMACEIRFVFEMPQAGLYYAFLDVPHADTATVIRGEKEQDVLLRPTAITALGRFEKGERVTLSAPIAVKDAQATGRVFVCRLDEGVFAEGYDVLSASQLKLTAWEDTLVTGTIDAAQDGLLYTAIPYDAGWRAFVDGVETAITPLAGAMICLPLEAGTHTVRLTYRSPGLAAGLAVSVGSACVLAGYAVLTRRRRRGGLCSNRALTEQVVSNVWRD